MKKNYLLPLIAVMAVFSAAAQPTFDFESWTGSGASIEPTGWVTINPLTILGNPQGVFQATGVDAHSGTYAMKIVTVALINNPSPAILHNPAAGAFTGTLQSPSTLIPGFPYTSRPTGISFWYKYAPVGNDSASWFVALTKWTGIARDTIAIGYTIINAPANAYTQAQFSLIYNPIYSAVTPDSLVIDINATCYATLTCGTVNSTLYVDDISFLGLTGVNENAMSSSISLFPNPTNGKVNVIISQLANLKMKDIEIYNVYGAKVYSNDALNFQINSSSNFQIDLSSQPSGVYFLHVKTEQGTAVKKIIKE